MDEYFAQLQEGVRRLLPILLLGPGIVMVIAGLFMWLGGLRCLKAVGAFTAAMAGLVGTWIYAQGQVVPMVLVPVILAGVGLYFNKLMVVGLGAAMVAGMVLIGPAIADFPIEALPESQTSSTQETPLDLLESVRAIEEQINRAKETVKEKIAGIPPSRKTLALAASVICAGIGILCWRFVCAATCSVIGTAEIFAGMTLLLLFKGVEALRQAAEYGVFLTAAAAAMVLLGTILQMWLCPAKQKKTDMAKELLNEEKKK